MIFFLLKEITITRSLIIFPRYHILFLLCFLILHLLLSWFYFIVAIWWLVSFLVANCCCYSWCCWCCCCWWWDKHTHIHTDNHNTHTHTHTHTHIYIYIFNKFPDFFVQTFKIVIDSWKFSMLLLFILWDDGPFFMITASNEQLQQQLEYTLLKPDCHSWWISKMQSGREVTLEERYAIKFCFILGENATETYGMLQTAFRPSCMNRASAFEWDKRFKKGRESVRDDERYERSKEVNIPELIG